MESFLIIKMKSSESLNITSSKQKNGTFNWDGGLLIPEHRVTNLYH